MSRYVHRVALAGLCGLLAALSLPAAAQVFRIVGPDGKVTFSDRPPPAPDAKTSRAATGGAAGASAGGNTASLPFELRNVANRYPVTLYTSTDCGPCNSARIFLGGRGIPFAERTVTTNEDASALRRLSGEVRVPFLTIGAQQLRGYSEAEWTQYLDAAGYPRNSQLPAGYRNPAAAPLVAQPVTPNVQPAAPAQEQATASPEPAPAAPEPANPAGIRF